MSLWGREQSWNVRNDNDVSSRVTPPTCPRQSSLSVTEGCCEARKYVIQPEGMGADAQRPSQEGSGKNSLVDPGL